MDNEVVLYLYPLRVSSRVKFSVMQQLCLQNMSNVRKFPGKMFVSFPDEKVNAVIALEAFICLFGYLFIFFYQVNHSSGWKISRIFSAPTRER